VEACRFGYDVIRGVWHPAVVAQHEGSEPPRDLSFSCKKRRIIMKNKKNASLRPEQIRVEVKAKAAASTLRVRTGLKAGGGNPVITAQRGGTP
jgi:hypothetical protein